MTAPDEIDSKKSEPSRWFRSQQSLNIPAKSTKESACPLCNSGKTKILKIIDVTPLIAQWQHYYQIDARPEFGSISQMELWHCASCSLSFFTPQSLAGSDQLYSQLDNNDWYYMQKKWEYEVALRDLKGRERILEVGCGDGAFLLLARQKASLEIQGLELNKKALLQATQRGFRVTESTVEAIAAQTQGAFDAVCSFQVLEHVPNPGSFVKACCALLRPGGVLLLGLPNADSFIRYQFNVLDMPPHHMTRWPMKTFSALPRLFPLRLRRTLLEPLAEYHLDLYVNAYFSHFARGAFRFLNHPAITARIVRLLHLGSRRMCRGQTIYVSYERT